MELNEIAQLIKESNCFYKHPDYEVSGTADEVLMQLKEDGGTLQSLVSGEVELYKKNASKLDEKPSNVMYDVMPAHERVLAREAGYELSDKRQFKDWELRRWCTLRDWLVTIGAFFGQFDDNKNAKSLLEKINRLIDEEKVNEDNRQMLHDSLDEGLRIAKHQGDLADCGKGLNWDDYTI